MACGIIAPLSSRVANARQANSRCDHGKNTSSVPDPEKSLARPLHPGEDASPPPDGGWEAWTQVFLSHLINFNSFGYMLSYGIFQSYYTETLHFSPSNVSWIGTTGLFLVYFVGVFSGRIMDAGYYRYTLTAGLSLQLIGVFTTSISTKYWQLFLAQGLCQGLGNGLLFCPAVALVSTYFSPGKRAFAMSLVASGGGTGGMVFPAIAQALLGRIGFAWTVRVMGFVMVLVSAIVWPFSRPRGQIRKPKAWLDLQAFREAPYVLFCVGIFLAFWGLYFGYLYVRPFGRDVLGVGQGTSFALLLVVNASGIPGRIGPAMVADRLFGPLKVIIPVILITGVVVYCWRSVDSLAGFYVWAAVYGFFAGGSQALFQAACSTFTTDMEKVGVRIGMVFTIVSFACLSGPPLSGRLIELLDGAYLAAQIFGGSVIVAGSGCLLLAWVAQRRTEQYNKK